MPDRVTCDKCDVTTRREVFLRHYNNVHLGLKPTEAFICDTCEAVHADKSNLFSHHVYRHSSVREPLLCAECNAVLRCRASLRSHLRTHWASECAAYHCDDCGFWTTARDYLAVHMRSRHLKTRVPECCDDCDYTSAWSKGHLFRHYCLEHLSILTAGARKAERVYTCDECAGRFCNRAGLLAHLRSAHADGTRAFSCDTCGYAAKSVHTVKDHVKRCSLKVVRQHRHEESTVCCECERAYIGSKSCQNLYDHWLRHHTAAVHWFAVQNDS